MAVNYLIQEIRDRQVEARRLAHNLALVERTRAGEHRAIVREQASIMDGLDRLNLISAPTAARDLTSR